MCTRLRTCGLENLFSVYSPLQSFSAYFLSSVNSYRSDTFPLSHETYYLVKVKAWLKLIRSLWDMWSQPSASFRFAQSKNTLWGNYCLPSSHTQALRSGIVIVIDRLERVWHLSNTTLAPQTQMDLNLWSLLIIGQTLSCCTARPPQVFLLSLVVTLGIGLFSAVCFYFDCPALVCLPDIWPLPYFDQKSVCWFGLFNKWLAHALICLHLLKVSGALNRTVCSLFLLLLL